MPPRLRLIGRWNRRLAQAAALGLLSGALAFASAAAPQGTVLHHLPETVDPAATYLIYLHGRIIEDGDPRPVHPRFGVYEYEAILNRLATEGIQVISALRPAGTETGPYAALVVDQIRELHAGGVPMDRITVVGFSKGAGIALMASSLMNSPEARFVLLAICGDWLDGEPDLRLKGRILSIYESSDEFGGSCRPLAERSPEGLEFEEVRIDTGERHGAFYRPRTEWMSPLLDWIKR